MPRTRVVLFKDDDGSVPFRDWLDAIPKKARIKCLSLLERLAERGYELRRPLADLLRDGIYELRVRQQHQNYRILYFFHGQMAAVVSHGLIKERIVPPSEIDVAMRRKKAFERDPAKHTHEVNLT
jgi:phage-related protein